jgi:hypothetical protein
MKIIDKISLNFIILGIINPLLIFTNLINFNHLMNLILIISIYFKHFILICIKLFI